MSKRSKLGARGDLKFYDRWEKPLHMRRKEWYGSDKGRTWHSKTDEVFSEFICRIVRDMEGGGAQILCYLIPELIALEKELRGDGE